MDENDSNQQKTPEKIISGYSIAPGVIDPRHLAVPTTPKNGDMFYSDGTNFKKLGAGASGQALVNRGGVPVWGTQGGATGPSGPTGSTGPTGGTGSTGPTGTTMANYSLRAYLGTNQSITNTTFTLVTLDTVDFDVGSNFSVSTHLYTAPVTGYYAIVGKVTFIDGSMVSGKRIDAALYINGTSVSETLSYATGTNGVTAHTSIYYKLTAGDTIGLYAYQETGGNASISGVSRYTYLAVHLINT